jgi:hypothetical protein
MNVKEESLMERTKEGGGGKGKVLESE